MLYVFYFLNSKIFIVYSFVGFRFNFENQQKNLWFKISVK